MGLSFETFKNILELPLAISCFLLQAIAIGSSWWGQFVARTDLGKPEEKGHYGLWSLCSTKAKPYMREDCDPLDTFFQVPPYITIAGHFSIAHSLFFIVFIVLGAHVLNFKVDCFKKSKSLRISKVLLSCASTVICFAIIALATVFEAAQEYIVSKGWAFWIQVVIAILDIVLLALSSIDCFRFMKLKKQQSIDPEGRRTETYGNPAFDNDSPVLPRLAPPPYQREIAFTESSGRPFVAGQIPTNNNFSRFPPVIQNPEVNSEAASHIYETLTFENECFLESSPRTRRILENCSRGRATDV